MALHLADMTLCRESEREREILELGNQYSSLSLLSFSVTCSVDSSRERRKEEEKEKVAASS